MATVDPSLVAHLPLFAGFSAEELGEMLREARSVRFPKNSAGTKQISSEAMTMIQSRRTSFIRMGP